MKLADLEDNSDISRIANPTARDRKRVEKYRRAIETIHALENGNNRLRERYPGEMSGT